MVWKNDLPDGFGPMTAKELLQSLRRGGGGWTYHFTALAAVACHTLVGLALAHSRLRLAITAYEMRPGGN